MDRMADTWDVSAVNSHVQLPHPPQGQAVPHQDVDIETSGEKEKHDEEVAKAKKEAKKHENQLKLEQLQ